MLLFILDLDYPSPRPQCAVNLDRNLKPKLAIMRQCTSVTDGQTDEHWHRRISARCIYYISPKNWYTSTPAAVGWNDIDIASALLSPLYQMYSSVRSSLASVPIVILSGYELLMHRRYRHNGNYRHIGLVDIHVYKITSGVFLVQNRWKIWVYRVSDRVSVGVRVIVVALWGAIGRYPDALVNHTHIIRHGAIDAMITNVLLLTT